MGYLEFTVTAILFAANVILTFHLYCTINQSIPRKFPAVEEFTVRWWFYFSANILIYILIFFGS